jgi:IS5 family transposase
LGDRLVDTGNLIDGDEFRPSLDSLYDNKTGRGGRPNIDVIVMLKSLFLQQLYDLSDEQLEREHLLMFMIVKWIWPKKAKFAMQIKDTS